MKKTITALASAAALIAVATPAVAAPTSGGRIEAIAGWDSNKMPHDEDLEDLGVNLDQSGIVFGVGVGYDFPIGPSASIGIDLEATETTSKEEFSGGGDSVDFRFGRDLYAGIRFTTAISDSANLFFRAGYTNLRAEATIDIDNDVENISANADGVRGGVGVQVALGTSAYLSAEYRYSNYEAGLSRHQAVGGIGFRF